MSHTDMVYFFATRRSFAFSGLIKSRVSWLYEISCFSLQGQIWALWAFSWGQQICSRGACDGSAPNLMLGELAWMPQTVSVLKYAQYFNKNRSQSPATTTATTSNPPASQRKHVAASQHKNQASTRVAAAAAAGVSLPKGPAKGIILQLVKL